ncbi:hypothetical protein MOKP50_36520 [Mycobacterium avium subsp. hominissuis]
MTITRPGAHRSTTSTGHASPTTTKATDSNPSTGNAATAEGVWVNTLTCSATNMPCSCCGETVTDSGTTTNRPPRNSAPNISHTDTSNANE